MMHNFFTTLVVCLAAVAYMTVPAMAQNQPPFAAYNAAPNMQMMHNMPNAYANNYGLASAVTAQHSFGQPSNTVVGRKVAEMAREVNGLRNRVAEIAGRIDSIDAASQAQAAEYFASIATINTQLQSGTTKSNPRLVQRLGTAESVLQAMNQNMADLNAASIELASIANSANYLLQTTRASYEIPGAVEEDHILLTQLEDTIDNLNVVINRMMNNINDDITRLSAYLSAERTNMRTLAAAVADGNFYGRSFGTRPFAGVPQRPNSVMQQASTPMNSARNVGGGRILAKIKFDKPNVEYKQPIYTALNNALAKYPNASFELVAVHPAGGNPAQRAIESSRARRNAEEVLRTITEMGIPGDRIALSYQENAGAAMNEVHLYVK